MTLIVALDASSSACSARGRGAPCWWASGSSPSRAPTPWSSATPSAGGASGACDGLPGGSGGLIRVMTVHGAKGLEAPIVILPDTGRRDVTIKDEIITVDGGLSLSGM